MLFHQDGRIHVEMLEPRLQQMKTIYENLLNL
ncbi:uncharacterized protein METZ01_LOCUS322746 [marine metagenome]|uniref:Uncharacterized protein n=1 Tax=marine metagenome TaxID=408172 RepID=A0A382PD81_9ZZZZ